MKFKAKKSPTTYCPKRAHRGHGVTAKQERELRRMAGLIQNEAHLQSVLLQTRPEMREAGLARIKPYLRFPLRKDFSLPV